MTVADEIAEALRDAGVETIFGQSLPSSLIIAAEKLGIRQVVYRTENAGGAMADGFARTSGRLGVVAAQNGPAAALLVAPLAEAYKVSTPLLALVQDVPAADRHRNAFQELDHLQLFMGCTKWIARLDSESGVTRMINLAMVKALSGRPGPVVLLLPKDLLARERGTLDPVVHPIRAVVPFDRPRPDGDAVNLVAQGLATAKNPLIVAGGGVHVSGAAGRLASIQEEFSIPVATTVMGKGAVDESHALSIGVVGSNMGRLSESHSQREYIDQVDFCLLVGTRTNENGTDAWSLLPSASTFAHLDVDAAEVGRNYSSIRLVGDARSGLSDIKIALADSDVSVRTSNRVDLEKRILRGKNVDKQRIASLISSNRGPLLPQQVMAALDGLLDNDDVIVADASYASIWVSTFLHARRSGQRFVAPRGIAGLGWGLPLALGAKVANPNARVVCVTGDGAFAHCWAELETSVREALPVSVVVLNNSVLGYQQHAELHQFGVHTTAIDIGPINYESLAHTCGVKFARVDRVDNLSQGMEAALHAGETFLLEAIVDADARPPISKWEVASE